MLGDNITPAYFYTSKCIITIKSLLRHSLFHNSSASTLPLNDWEKINIKASHLNSIEVLWLEGLATINWDSKVFQSNDFDVLIAIDADAIQVWENEGWIRKLLKQRDCVFLKVDVLELWKIKKIYGDPALKMQENRLPVNQILRQLQAFAEKVKKSKLC